MIFSYLRRALTINVLFGLDDDVVDLEPVFDVFSKVAPLDNNNIKDDCLLQWCIHASRQIVRGSASDHFHFMSKFVRYQSLTV